MPDLDLALTSSLHPHLELTPHPPADGCLLHLALVLPDALFPDPDELRDLWGAEGLKADPSESTSPLALIPLKWALTPSDIDIERPLRPSPPVHLSLVAAGSVDIPLHARYLPPSPSGGHNVTVFGKGGGSVARRWECSGVLSELETLDITLTHVLPAADGAYRVPVEIATAAVVWAGWAWIMFRLFRAVHRTEKKGKTE